MGGWGGEVGVWGGEVGEWGGEGFGNMWLDVEERSLMALVKAIADCPTNTNNPVHSKKHKPPQPNPSIQTKNPNKHRTYRS